MNDAGDVRSGTQLGQGPKVQPPAQQASQSPARQISPQSAQQASPQAAQAPASGPIARAGTRTTTYRVERPRKAGPLAVAAKIALTLVFAATAALCAYRAAVPAATPHGRVPASLVAVGYAGTALMAVVLTAAGIFWVLRGARFADSLALAVLWPIATVLTVIVAGASVVPQHYLRIGYVLVPAGLAAVAMMVAVAWVYNRSSGR
jgi:hypothetical protein